MLMLNINKNTHMTLKHIQPLLIIGIFFLFQPGDYQLRLALEYERTSILRGELWRLFTANFIHLDVAHALMNALGIVVFYMFYGKQLNTMQWIKLCILIPTGISLLLLFAFPQIIWFAGFSGALYGFIVCASLLAWRRDKPEHLIVLTIILIKLGMEQYYGSLSSALDIISSLVLVEAHTAGAIIGVVVGILMRWQAEK